MKRFIIFGCLIGIVLFVAIVLHLSQITTTEINFIIVPQSIEELTTASDIIITGEVISSQPLLLTQRLRSSMPLEEYEEFIVTRYDVRVDEYLKGSGPSTVRVNLLGGQVGKRIFIAPDEASMEVGERVLLFLASSEEDHDYYAGPNSYVVVGYYQGKYSIRDNLVQNKKPALNTTLNDLIKQIDSQE